MATARTRRVVHLVSALVLPLSPALGFAETASHALQVASLSSRRDAEQEVRRLRARGLDAYWLQADVPSKGVRYRVRIGRFPTSAAARADGDRLRVQGIVRDFIVTGYETPPGVVLGDLRAAGTAAPDTPSPPPPTAPVVESPPPAPPPTRNAGRRETGEPRAARDCRPIAPFVPARLVAWCVLPRDR